MLHTIGCFLIGLLTLIMIAAVFTSLCLGLGYIFHKLVRRYRHNTDIANLLADGLLIALGLLIIFFLGSLCVWLGKALC